MLPLSFNYISSDYHSSYNISLASVQNITMDGQGVWTLTVLEGTTRLEESRAEHANYVEVHHYHTWPALTGQIVTLPQGVIRDWFFEVYFAAVCCEV